MIQSVDNVAAAFHSESRGGERAGTAQPAAATETALSLYPVYLAHLYVVLRFPAIALGSGGPV